MAPDRPCAWLGLTIPGIVVPLPLRSAASPYQKAAATRAAERALRPWAPYGAGMGERDGAVLAQLGPAAAPGVAAGPSRGENPPGGLSPTALYEIAPEAAKAIGEAAGRVSLLNKSYPGMSG